MQIPSFRDARIVRRSVDEGRTWQRYDDAIPWTADLPGNAFAFRYVQDGSRERLYYASDAGFYALDLASDEPLPPIEREPLVVIQPSHGILRIIGDYGGVPQGVEARAELYNVLGQRVANATLRRYGERAFYGELAVGHLAAGDVLRALSCGRPSCDRCGAHTELVLGEHNPIPERFEQLNLALDNIPWL